MRSLLILIIGSLCVGLIYYKQIMTKVPNPAKSIPTSKIGKIPQKIPLNQLPGATKRSLEDFAKNQQEKLDNGAPTEDEK